MVRARTKPTIQAAFPFSRTRVFCNKDNSFRVLGFGVSQNIINQFRIHFTDDHQKPFQFGADEFEFFKSCHTFKVATIVSAKSVVQISRV